MVRARFTGWTSRIGARGQVPLEPYITVLVSQIHICLISSNLRCLCTPVAAIMPPANLIDCGSLLRAGIGPDVRAGLELTLVFKKQRFGNKGRLNF